jgi:hypothetical protein
MSGSEVQTEVAIKQLGKVPVPARVTCLGRIYKESEKTYEANLSGSLPRENAAPAWQHEKTHCRTNSLLLLCSASAKIMISDDGKLNSGKMILM